MRLALPLTSLLLCTFFLTGLAYAQESTSVSAVEAASIPLLDWSFSPGDVTVHAGGTVRWSTQGFLEHTVTADDGSFNGTLTRSQPLALTFASPGVYSYICTPHPWMKGTVTVLAATAPVESPEGEQQFDIVGGEDTGDTQPPGFKG